MVRLTIALAADWKTAPGCGCISSPTLTTASSAICVWRRVLQGRRGTRTAVSSRRCSMTRHMEVEYLRPVPLGVPLTLTAQHTGATGRRNHTEAQLKDASGQVLATAKAVFVTVNPELMKARQRSFLK
jgi:hypothetical protein